MSYYAKMWKFWENDFPKFALVIPDTYMYVGFLTGF